MSHDGFQSLSAVSGLDIRVEDIEDAISRRNPAAPRARVEQVVDIIGRIAEMSDAIAQLSSKEPATQIGPGLGDLIGPDEGARRLAAYALPIALEDWAGPVAKPSEVASRFGIARSTLDEWRRSGAVIGLLAGARKHVFPLAQFVDGRPVGGLDQLASIIGDPRSLWLWLVEPASRGAATWLEQLRGGKLAEVLAAAREDFA